MNKALLILGAFIFFIQAVHAYDFATSPAYAPDELPVADYENPDDIGVYGVLHLLKKSKPINDSIFDKEKSEYTEEIVHSPGITEQCSCELQKTKAKLIDFIAECPNEAPGCCKSHCLQELKRIKK